MDRSAVLQRKLAEARQQQREWQAKIDANPTASTHQLGVWRARVTRWRHTEQALLRRLNQ